LDALRRNTAPDVLGFDNMGVLEGITSALGKFEGIGQMPTIRRDLIQVTGAFDGLLGPARGWTYLFAAGKPINPGCGSGPDAPHSTPNS
jgi:hypothetical protein